MPSMSLTTAAMRAGGWNAIRGAGETQRARVPVVRAKRLVRARSSIAEEGELRSAACFAPNLYYRTAGAAARSACFAPTDVCGGRPYAAQAQTRQHGANCEQTRPAHRTPDNYVEHVRDSNENTSIL